MKRLLFMFCLAIAQLIVSPVQAQNIDECLVDVSFGALEELGGENVKAQNIVQGESYFIIADGVNAEGLVADPKNYKSLSILFKDEGEASGKQLKEVKKNNKSYFDSDSDVWVHTNGRVYKQAESVEDNYTGVFKIPEGEDIAARNFEVSPLYVRKLYKGGIINTCEMLSKDEVVGLLNTGVFKVVAKGGSSFLILEFAGANYLFWEYSLYTWSIPIYPASLYQAYTKLDESISQVSKRLGDEKYVILAEGGGKMKGVSLFSGYKPTMGDFNDKYGYKFEGAEKNGHGVFLKFSGFGDMYLAPSKGDKTVFYDAICKKSIEQGAADEALAKKYSEDRHKTALKWLGDCLYNSSKKNIYTNERTFFTSHAKIPSGEEDAKYPLSFSIIGINEERGLRFFYDEPALGCAVENVSYVIITFEDGSSKKLYHFSKTTCNDDANDVDVMLDASTLTKLKKENIKKIVISRKGGTREVNVTVPDFMHYRLENCKG